ncbi:hypothetical protein A5630_14405 [Mycolicibacterium mucogenicum]|uniref:Uncharacterized protein n=1 Tax=Mycolicibacterium mucogenicum TaxID=56689 RepID=A0A1A3HCC7_MYCMU|nr:hypothetical protein A5630_14405 [Mycolicibacterium mucogenicum]
MAVDDAVGHELVQVPDEHALGDLGNAAPELGGAHRSVREPPQNGAFPAAVDHRQGGVDRALTDFLLRHRHDALPSLLR